MKNLFVLLSLMLLGLGCRSYLAKPYDFPKPVDTTNKVIEIQEKKVYALTKEGVFADNLFDGARLNDFQWLEGNRFRATISPENQPINKSPYYAFKLWASSPKSIQLELHYTFAAHRYDPKWSKDGQTWQLLDQQLVQWDQDSVHVTLSLNIDSDTLWLAGQEVQNSKHVHQWCAAKATHPNAQLSNIGQSKQGRELWCLDIHDGLVQKKEIIAILSRQHPPEVTGWFAMQAFVDEILADNPLANAFRKKYRILVFPLLNPDGVDMGHWRHNAGGIDLNRDWAYYHQPETRQVANYIVKAAKTNKSNVILGLDFHSTYWDIYYTNREIPKHLPHFKDYWLWGIHQALDEKTNERPSNIGGPVSKNWFLTQFGAVGITYEIGDSTPRDFIKEKGKVSATEMMELLILR